MREIMLMVLVILSVPLVFKRPVWGMAIYLGINVVRPEMLFWGGSTGSYLFKLYFGLIMVASLYQSCLRNVGRIFNREFLLMIWLFVAVLVSVELATFPVFRGNYYIIELFKGFIICALLYVLVDEFSDLRRIQHVLLGCFAFLGAWGIQQQFLGNERLEGLGGHAWSDSNGIAATFVLYLPLAVIKVYLSKKPKDFWISLGIVVVMLSLIVCTKSRAGLVGVCASLAALGFFARNIRKVMFTSLFLIIVAMPFVTENYMSRVKTMGSTQSLDTSARLRLVMWQAGLKIFSDNPIFGTGFLSFAEAKMDYEHEFSDLDEDLRESAFRKDSKRVAHNSYIQMLSDCGLFGAAPFFLLIAGGMLAGLNARRFLVTLPDKKNELLWLCGLSAGIAGYAVCIMSLDATFSLFLYTQLVFVGILTRIVSGHHKVATATEHPHMVAGEVHARWRRNTCSDQT